MVVVRRANETDVDAACKVLAEAFSDYPWTRWTVDASEHVQRIESLQRLFMERVALPYGEVWVAVEEDDTVVSVAMWSLPATVVPSSVSGAIGADRVRLEGSRFGASVAAEEAVALLRPTRPHYYLGAVGTRTDRQRMGLGAAVLNPVLVRSVKERVDVYLETSSRANVGFYRRLGFGIVGELTIAGGGGGVNWFV